MSITIREACDSDAGAIWEIFSEVISHEDTYVFPADMHKDDALRYWMGNGVHCYIVEEDGSSMLGTYIIKDNQPGLGSHIANASFMVHHKARGKKIGVLMGRHALEEAKRLGYRGMQFNMVISTNIHAITLWKQLGFKIIGTIPAGFKHQSLGYVDAHIMYQSLV